MAHGTEALQVDSSNSEQCTVSFDIHVRLGDLIQCSELQASWRHTVGPYLKMLILKKNFGFSLIKINKKLRINN